ncbi:hypothetical protein [Porphyromonas sp. COT-239 OH1446]|uniref:hypothetical protein n=1 Tax=Porphyromonas sp. COT-239 OH1446 TaxID=1515613 RepID=UPI00052D2259|nr:hypothetical protein [Porphyromonas sp. COT-239 OH1446]KGN69876.1 hypothetical protein HQ37_05060 [Porphyromonas sp. COT-239 OH1446]
MHRLTFDLIQHTPIIHFQSVYRGATLRASEVKPKLDKYLLKYHAQHIAECDKSIHGESDAQEKRISLNYKLSFEAEDVITWPADRKNAPMYFGNIGDGKPKNLVFASGGVTMTILVGRQNRECQEKPKLADWLNSDSGHEAICNFFMLHNFGSRESKGYGSFTVKEDGLLKRGDNCYRYLSFEIKIRPYRDEGSKESEEKKREKRLCNAQREIFSTINYFYRTLRSGLNECRGGGQSVLYMKPMIFYYAANKRRKTWWDKRSIKYAFALSWLQMHDEDHQYHETNKDCRIDYRDIFGLSTNESWGAHYDNIAIKKTCFSSNKEVNRMKSPLQFKPILLSEYEGKQIYRVYIGIFEEEVGLSELVANETIVKVKAIRNDQEITPQHTEDPSNSISQGTSDNDNSLPLTFPKIESIVDVINFRNYQTKLQNELICIDEEGKRIRDLLLGIYKQLAKCEQKWKDTIEKEKSTSLSR